MTITPIGFVLIPLSLIIFLVWPRLLVPWAIIVSVFEAASVINFGGGDSAIGLQPFFLVVILITLRFVPQYLSGRFGFAQDDPILRLFRPLVLFTLWGVVSAFVLPFLFAGVPVNIPHGGMDRSPLPLHWSLSNVAQAGYLMLDCIFIMYTTRLARDHREMEANVQAFRSAGMIVIAVGIYQLIAHNTGLYFPKEFFNSNEAWGQLLDEKIAGAWRLSATYTEPSAAGGFFAAWSSFLLIIVSERSVARRLDWLLLCAGMSMLLLTTSSSGYVVTVAVLSTFGLQQLVRLIVKGKINPRVLIVGVVLGAAAVGAIAFLPNLDRLIQEVLIKKAQSSSAKNRTATQWQALIITGQSLGLGVGLGSNRPSGLLFYILSDLGIPGLLLFVYCIYVTFSLIGTSTGPRLRCSTARGYLKASGWALGVNLFSMVISGADAASPQTWIIWSLIAGALEHACVSSRQESIVRDHGAGVRQPFGLVETARFG